MKLNEYKQYLSLKYNIEFANAEMTSTMVVLQAEAFKMLKDNSLVNVKRIGEQYYLTLPNDYKIIITKNELEILKRALQNGNK